MYGPNYIVEPVYVHPPVFFVFFWGPRYNPWYSPYYYGYYPPYYRPWRPYPTSRYQTNIHVHVNVNNTYNRTTVRKSEISVELQKKSKRNDYAKKNPDKSFAKSNKGVSNKAPIGTGGKVDNSKVTKPTTKNKSTGKKVQENWTPPSKIDKKNVRKSTKDFKTSNTKVENKVNKVPENKPKDSIPKVNQRKSKSSSRAVTTKKRK